MAIELEKIVTVGDHQVAAVVQRNIVHDRRRCGVTGWFVKRPLAILITDGTGIRAFDPHGVPIALEDVERLCPGAKQAFGRRTR